MDDHYRHPVRIVAFNTAEGWSRDVTMDIADELRRRFAEYDEARLCAVAAACPTATPTTKSFLIMRD